MHASSKFVPNTYKHCLASRQRKRMDSENSESCNSIHRLVTLPPDFVVENTHKSRIKLAYRKRKEERTRFDVRRDPWDYFIVSFLFRTLQEQYFGLLDLVLTWSTSLFHRYFSRNFSTFHSFALSES